MLPAREKAGHIDEDVLVQLFDLRRLFLQEIDIRRQIVLHVQHHPPLDTPTDRAVPITAEVDANFGAQQSEHLLIVLIVCRRHYLRSVPLRMCDVRMPAYSNQLAADVVRAQHKIHAAAAHRALRHCRKPRGLFVLGDCYAACGLDLLHPERAIRAAARKNHTDRGSVAIRR